MLVLPSFTPANSIRIDYPAASTAGAPVVVTGVTETGSGGYDPGNKVPLWSRDLHPRIAQRLNDEVRTAMVQNPPPRLALAEPQNGKVRICGDGTTYVFETLDRDSGERLVSRHSCDFGRDASLVALIEAMHAAGRLTVPYEIARIVYAR